VDCFPLDPSHATLAVATNIIPHTWIRIVDPAASGAGPIITK